MANISLTLYINGFIGSVLMSPIQMGSLRVNNSVTNISRLGTFNGAKTPERMHIFAEISHFGFYEFFIQRICNLQRGGGGAGGCCILVLKGIGVFDEFLE